MSTMVFTKDTLTLLSQYDSSALTDDQFALLVRIAISRLQALLCDSTIDASSLEEALAPLLADLVSDIANNNPANVDVQSETAENYSYSRRSGVSSNSLDRLQDKYADVIREFSKCENADGEIENATHNPLWTPDYYKEILQ